ncbi:MAG: transglycosylase SLT domain-containing protein [Synergistaceae bacterium]|nr:transglycosylase SLT domain-containing protein [Synergistaceae bacterium]
MEEKIINIVNEKANKYGVSPLLALAIIQVLALCAAWMRYEPLYRWTLPQAQRPAGCNMDTELVLQRCSIGLMQVMGAWAREQGFDGWLTELIDPENNIDVGCARLAALSSRYEKRFGVEGVISAYLGITPRKGPDGKFLNQNFVNKVIAAMPSEDTPEAALMKKTVAELKEIAKEKDITIQPADKKADIVAAILAANEAKEE